jgi:hypothetical protein
MSKLAEIQNQYQGYVAAIEAVAKTNPGEVEVVYKKGNEPHDDGIFIYYPEKEKIKITPRRCNSTDYVFINIDDVPALIKALREFFE